MPHEPVPDAPVVGLVLSGGGARSSFQIGALRYLYDEVGITPSVIAGTSAGSIIGAVLAQSATHEGQLARLDQLEQLWRALRSSADMFTELPWFERLRERGPAWIDALERRKRRQGVLGRSFKRVADRRHGTSTAAGRAAAPDASPDASSAPLPPVLPGRALAGALPVPPPTRTAGHRSESGWVPARLLESIDTLRTVGRASSDLEEIVEGAQRERSMFRPGPLVERLVDPEVFDPAAVTASGMTLRIAVVALESGELRYATETGALVDREDRPVESGTVVELVQAIRASCAIPVVFAPVRLGEENYVDGGVRENLPAEIAMTHLGVDTCYAVVAGPLTGLAREASFDDKDMISIVVRTTTAIMTDEVQRDDVVRARAAGAVVIAPDFDVHDTLTIEAGLVAIAIDYGYLRAAEEHHGATVEDRALTREIIELRRDIWRAEDLLFFDPEATEHDVDPEATEHEAAPAEVAEIVARKLELRDLLLRVPTGRLPPGAQRWWRGWETHASDIPVDPGWATDPDAQADTPSVAGQTAGTLAP